MREPKTDPNRPVRIDHPSRANAGQSTPVRAPDSDG